MFLKGYWPSRQQNVTNVRVSALCGLGASYPSFSSDLVHYFENDGKCKTVIYTMKNDTKISKFLGRNHPLIFFFYCGGRVPHPPAFDAHIGRYGQGCGAVTFLVGSGSGSGEAIRLRLRLQVKLFGGSDSGYGQNVPAPAAPAPAPMIKSSYEP